VSHLLKKKFRGKSVNRLRYNPLEKAFAVAWQAENDRPGSVLLDYLLHATPEDFCRPAQATKEEHFVAATLIQWLGTNVGKCFLRDVLMTKAGQEFLASHLRVKT
jgi:hypothetical protein